MAAFKPAVMGVMAVPYPASTRNIALGTVCRLPWNGTTAFGGIG
jgi:hypothetical protein